MKEYIINFMVNISRLFKACDTQGIPQKVDIPIIDQKYLALIRMFIADKGYTSIIDGGTLYLGRDEDSIRAYIRLIDLIAF